MHNPETYEKDKVKREYEEGLNYLRTKEAHDLENETKVYEAEQKVARLILITQYTDRIAELRAGYNPYGFLDRNATEAMQREIEFLIKRVIDGIKAERKIRQLNEVLDSLRTHFNEIDTK